MVVETPWLVVVSIEQSGCSAMQRRGWQRFQDGQVLCVESKVNGERHLSLLGRRDASQAARLQHNSAALHRPLPQPNPGTPPFDISTIFPTAMSTT